MTEIKNSLLVALAFTCLFGLFLWVRYDIHTALLLGSLSGLAFGTILYLFVNSKAENRQTEIKIPDGQPIIYSGKANHFLNNEAVGGKLYLLADRLEFKSHSFNSQNHALNIPLLKIQEIGFYNVLGLVPTGLSIILVTGEIEKFVINNRRVWRDKIKELKKPT